MKTDSHPSLHTPNMHPRKHHMRDSCALMYGDDALPRLADFMRLCVGSDQSAAKASACVSSIDMPAMHEKDDSGTHVCVVSTVTKRGMSRISSPWDCKR